MTFGRAPHPGRTSSTVKWLATSFAQIGKPKSVAQINRCILAGLGSDWEPLVLALSPSRTARSTDELSALLLNNEARRQFIQDWEHLNKFFGILGAAPAEINYADGLRQQPSSSRRYLG